MYVKRFEEGEKIAVAGNRYVMLLPRELTNSFEVVIESIAPGAETPLNAHDDLDQCFLILQGSGLLRVGDETQEVGANSLAFIPRNTLHNIRCLGRKNLEYIYVNVWPEGIPSDRREWRSAYRDMQNRWGADVKNTE